MWEQEGTFRFNFGAAASVQSRGNSDKQLGKPTSPASELHFRCQVKNVYFESSWFTNDDPTPKHVM